MTRAAPQPVGSPLSLRELGELLVKHYDLHDGTYDVLVEFRIGTGRIGPSSKDPLPGAMIGFSGVGLIKTDAPTVNSVDAKTVNPAKRAKKRSARHQTTEVD